MKAQLMPTPNRVISVAEMQALERSANADGHTYATMMEIAGRSVAELIIAQSQGAPAGERRALVLVGPGNNGGDGLVCARYLYNAWFTVDLYLWRRRIDPAADDKQYERTVALSIGAVHADSDPDFAILRGWLTNVADRPTVIVDALLGTGANRPITGQLADLLDVVKVHTETSAIPVVAVDCPSGLNADTGAIDPHALAADQTVTFAYAKAGHYQFPGAGVCGHVQVADIGIPSDLAEEAWPDAPPTFVLDAETVRGWLPKRANNSHKGSFGKVMAAVGSYNFPGAAYLSCSAAGRVGAGLITGAVTEAVWSVVAGKLPEPTWLPLPTGTGDEAGVIAEAAAPLLLAGLTGYSALILGCGLNKKPTTVRFVERLLAARAQLPPTLIDADGLNCLALLDQWPCPLPANVVLTPHAAELGRLCDLPVATVVAQRWALARAKAAEWNAVVLAKGPYTVIAHPDGRLAVLPIATPALATAGTGDVLSGTIGGLLAQGVAPFEAACVGAWLHGEAGLRCAMAIGNAGVMASDLLPHLPHVLRDLQQ